MKLVLALGALLYGGASAAGQSAAAGFLWRVDGPHATHYLAGSVHLLPQSAAGLPSALMDAYRKTDGIVFESDLGALSSTRMQQEVLRDGAAATPLRKRLGEKLYARLQARAAELGAPKTACDAYRAWFCAMTLDVLELVHAGFQADLGVDRQLYERAKADGKPIAWLEPPERHMALLTKMPDAMSLQFLRAELDDTSNLAQSPRALLGAWRRGDLRVFDRLVTAMRKRYPGLYARMFRDRNRAWLPKLEKLINGRRSQLVVVGAAHFAGPDGLLRELRRAGYRLQRVVPPAASAHTGG